MPVGFAHSDFFLFGSDSGGLSQDTETASCQDLEEGGKQWPSSKVKGYPPQAQPSWKRGASRAGCCRRGDIGVFMGMGRSSDLFQIDW
jgi:hypothetical protein